MEITIKLALVGAILAIISSCCHANYHHLFHKFNEPTKALINISPINRVDATNDQIIKAIAMSRPLNDILGEHDDFCRPEVSDVLVNELKKFRRKANGIFSQVVSHFGTKHVDECQENAKQKFKILRQSIGRTENDDIVHQISTKLVQDNAAYRNSPEKPKYHNRLLNIDPIDALRYIHIRMVRMGIEPDQWVPFHFIPLTKENFDFGNAFKSIENYWTYPCKQHLAHYREIFKPIEVELEAVQFSLPQWNINNELDRDFFQTWANYHLCERLVSYGTNQIITQVRKYTRAEFRDMVKTVASSYGPARQASGRFLGRLSSMFL